MKNSIKSFYNDIGKKKSFWLPVLLFGLLAYGFSLTRNTLSVDDMSLDYYGGIRGAIVASGRWGMEVWHKILCVGGYSAFIYKFFGFVFLLASAFLVCCIFYNLNNSGNHQVYPYTFFASILITFPLINEIWEYSGANAILTGNLMLVFFTMLYILFSDHKNLIKFIVGGIMLTLVASSYESALFVYITAVLCVLFYRYCIVGKQEKAYSWVIDGLKFVPSVIIAVILRFIVSFIWMKVFSVTPQPMGSTQIGWSNFSFNKLSELIQETVSKYFQNFDYIPILIWIIAVLVFVLYLVYRIVKNRSVLPLILGGLIVLSVFLLSFIQLKIFSYRTGQTVNFVVAFIVFILAVEIQSFNKKWLSIALVALLSLLTVYQATYLSKLMELNNVRSENELAIVHQLGMELTRDYKKDNKPIVFCGEYEIGNYITSRVSVNGQKTTHSNHLSLLTWSSTAFARRSQVNIMKKLFSYCGYDLNIINKYGKKGSQHIIKYAKKIGMKQFEIRDVGDYILVFLG